MHVCDDSGRRVVNDKGPCQMGSVGEWRIECLTKHRNDSLMKTVGGLVSRTPTGAVRFTPKCPSQKPGRGSLFGYQRPLRLQGGQRGCSMGVTVRVVVERWDSSFNE